MERERDGKPKGVEGKQWCKNITELLGVELLEKYGIINGGVLIDV
jgi:hypothetical protein